MYIGMSDRDVEKTFQYVYSGGPLRYTNWSPNEPNNAGNEDCVAMWASSLWNDYPCTWILNAACERLTCKFLFLMELPTLFLIGFSKSLQFFQ